MKDKDEFFKRVSFPIGDGVETHFWKDIWLGNTPLSQ
jgi:hypothetical protein